MKLHRAGYLITLKLTIVALILMVIANFVIVDALTKFITCALILIALLALISFFRKPKRYITIQDNAILSSVDGKVVVIEKVFEPDHFKDERMQVSIFMSPMNVHANWYPVDGKIIRSEHQKGKFHKAWLPKASTENERSLVVIRMEDGREILVRQIAGAMARRIVTYASAGEECFIDQHMGFIKFGSRVDLYLPLDADIQVVLNQKTVGNETVIANLK